MNARINDKKISRLSRRAWLIFSAVLVTGIGICWAAAVSEQKTFADGQAAVDAFVKAVREDNQAELLALFGADANELISSGDPFADRLRRNLFIKAYDQQHRLEAETDKQILIVGRNEWPFPIPLVRQGHQWIFDTAAGMEEILNRRVGLNELQTIQVMLAVVDAQREYAATDRDTDGLLEYAQKFNSDPNTKDGLYWKTEEGQPPSPLGALVAQAKREGYQKASAEEPRPYFGYIYRILSAQGEHAAGGAFDYLVKDSMVGGFAVIACPAEYGNSGVMTFLVSHDGVVYQKDLGEDTEQEAAKITLFDPDETWTKAQ
jgi:hypothetical protein